ncbi:MAG: TIGR02611 family protein [Agromyces sp.]
MTDANSPFEPEVREEISEAFSPRNPIRRWFGAQRAWARSHPQFRLIYLVMVALVGMLMVIVGLVLVPLPGPGWLVVFLGLAVLGTEFLWARRLTGWARRKIEWFWSWWRTRRSGRAR